LLLELLWLTSRYDKNEEPYLQPLHKILYEDEDSKNGLRVIAVVPRHGADGDTLKQSSKSVYAWKQAMLLPNEPEVDENGLETPWEHPPFVTGFLEYFNSSEMQEEFSSIHLIKHTHRL
jgi:inner membrane protein involved in colicin E2 resistance